MRRRSSRFSARDLLRRLVGSCVIGGSVCVVELTFCGACRHASKRHATERHSIVRYATVLRLERGVLHPSGNWWGRRCSGGCFSFFAAAFFISRARGESIVLDELIMNCFCCLFASSTDDLFLTRCAYAAFGMPAPSRSIFR